MGHRTLKRVPLNFQWPLHKVWKGYINPNSGPQKCAACDGSGYNVATREISENFYDNEGFGHRWMYNYGVGPDGQPATRPPWAIVGVCRAWASAITQDEVEALVKQGRLYDFTHEYKPGEGWKPKRWETQGFWCPVCHLSVPQLSLSHHTAQCTGCKTEMKLLPGDDVRLHTPLAEEVNQWNQSGMGHDSINRWILIEARAKRLGVFGKCTKCKGKGETRLPRKTKKRYNEWKEYEPPTGDGYQLWETYSEGSPVSPVFASPEELATWCSVNATIFGDEKTSRENWLEMFIDEAGVEVGSFLIGNGDYFGALINAPRG